MTSTTSTAGCPSEKPNQMKKARVTRALPRVPEQESAEAHPGGSDGGVDDRARQRDHVRGEDRQRSEPPGEFLGAGGVAGRQGGATGDDVDQSAAPEFARPPVERIELDRAEDAEQQSQRPPALAGRGQRADGDRGDPGTAEGGQQVGVGAQQDRAQGQQHQGVDPGQAEPDPTQDVVASRFALPRQPRVVPPFPFWTYLWACIGSAPGSGPSATRFPPGGDPRFDGQPHAGLAGVRLALA